VTSNTAFRVEHSADLATWTTNASSVSTGILTSAPIPFHTNAGYFRIAVPVE
jgi:hypothetical protein